jgi:hypothetical protein
MISTPALLRIWLYTPLSRSTSLACAAAEWGSREESSGHAEGGQFARDPGASVATATMDRNDRLRLQAHVPAWPEQ